MAKKTTKTKSELIEEIVKNVKEIEKDEELRYEFFMINIEGYFPSIYGRWVGGGRCRINETHPRYITDDGVIIGDIYSPDGSIEYTDELEVNLKDASMKDLRSFYKRTLEYLSF